MKSPSLAPLALIALCAQLGAQTPKPPIIELRVAVTTPKPGYAPRKLADSTFYVSDSVLFSDVDIERADTLWSEGILSVSFRLTSEAAARMGAITKDHVGDRVATFFNGEFASAVVLVSDIGTRRGRLQTLGPPKAQALAAQIVARWPPRR